MEKPRVLCYTGQKNGNAGRRGPAKKAGGGNVKRWIVWPAALILAALCACGRAPAPAPADEPPAPVTVREPEEPVSDPAPQRVPPDPAALPWEVSAPMAEDAAEPDPGSTLLTWDPLSAEAFPADVYCGEAALLEKWLAAEGLTEADLAARGCDQLILTAAQPYDPEDEEAEAFHAVAVCYERDGDGRWQTAVPGRMEAFVGRRGICHDRVQGDRTSPAGLWALGLAFGNEPMPAGLLLPWRDVTPQSEWISDNDSLYYNTWQELGDPALTDDWAEAEHLEDHAGYALACVIRFNMYPYTVRDRGNAIFLHCSEGPTSGCVGLSREDMETVLLWLDPDAHPHILITGYEAP